MNKVELIMLLPLSPRIFVTKFHPQGITTEIYRLFNEKIELKKEDSRILFASVHGEL